MNVQIIIAWAALLGHATSAPPSAAAFVQPSYNPSHHNSFFCRLQTPISSQGGACRALGKNSNQQISWSTQHMTLLNPKTI